MARFSVFCWLFWLKCRFSAVEKRTEWQNLRPKSQLLCYSRPCHHPYTSPLVPLGSSELLKANQDHSKGWPELRVTLTQALHKLFFLHKFLIKFLNKTSTRREEKIISTTTLEVQSQYLPSRSPEALTTCNSLSWLEERWLGVRLECRYWSCWVLESVCWRN